MKKTIAPRESYELVKKNTSSSVVNQSLHKYEKLDSMADTKPKEVAGIIRQWIKGDKKEKDKDFYVKL